MQGSAQGQGLEFPATTMQGATASEMDFQDAGHLEHESGSLELP